MLTIVHVNVPMAVHKLVSDLHPLLSLCDLEREGDVGDARYSRLPEISDRILPSILEVLLPPRECCGQVRNHAIRRIDNGALPGTYAVGSSLQLPVRGRRGLQHLRNSR